MRFTIVTPSYGQLDWLELCVASVRDQVESAEADGGKVGKCEGTKGGSKLETGEGRPETGNGRVIDAGTGGIFIEHIVQDAGTPGIEEFARRVGARFFRAGDGEQPGGVSEDLHGPRGRGYSLTIYSEKDAGMYDAINKGLRKATGDVCAYLNCDEQYLPGTLRWVANYFLLSPKVDVLFGAAIVTRADGSYVCDRRVMVPGDWHTRVSGNLSFFTAATFFRNTLVSRDKLYFDTAWKALGDAVWGLSLLKARVSMTAADRPLAIHTDTGNNLILSDMAIREKAQLEATASPLLAKAKKLIIFLYRLRRFIGGSYFLVPHQYQIYTVGTPEHRKTFTVNKPTHHWSGR